MKKFSSFVKYTRLNLNNLLIRLMNRKIKPKKYYLSLCTIFKNEAKYMKEWLDFHLIVGFEHFYVYNNFSEDNYKEVLKPYIDKGLVTLTEWPHKAGQMSAYNDCIKQFGDESNWIAFMDADEFAVPKKFADVKSWLKKYEAFPCVLGFFKDFSSSGIMNENPNELVTEKFVLCSDYVSPSMFLNTAWSGWIKEFRMTHFCRFKFFNKVCPENGGFWCGWHKGLKIEDFQFNHYHCRSYEYYINNKIPRGDAFSSNFQHSLERFYNCEQRAGFVDFNAYRYLVKLKNFDLDTYCSEKQEKKS